MLDQQISKKLETINLMVDVETTGISVGSGIWQIGAVVVETGEMISITINPRCLYKDGRFQSEQATIEWQETKNKQNWEAALAQPFEEDSIKNMLHSFDTWVRGLDAHSIQFWSKGHFDFPHLTHLYKVFEYDLPWGYRNQNDLRTLCNFFGLPVPNFSGAHNALEDALHQARHLKRLIDIRNASIGDYDG